MYSENKEALEYLVSLGEIKILTIGGHEYSTKEIFRIKELKPAAIVVTTLTALVDYIKANIDKKSSEKLVIHVKSPQQVLLYSELREDKDRECYIQCDALLPNNIYYNRFMDTEDFNIMLQSSFVFNDDRELLLKVVGCIQDKEVKDVSDDGVSQAVTIKTGVAKVGDVVVPNPVSLAPYRTFPEINQPKSKFIFRMQSGPRAAIYEADGGAWRNEAMYSIKNYLEKELAEGLDNIKIIS